MILTVFLCYFSTPSLKTLCASARIAGILNWSTLAWPWSSYQGSEWRHSKGPLSLWVRLHQKVPRRPSYRTTHDTDQFDHVKSLSISYDYDCLSVFVLIDFCQDINNSNSWTSNQIESLISYNSLPKCPTDLNIYFFSAPEAVNFETISFASDMWYVELQVSVYFGPMIVGTVSRYILSFSAVYNPISDQNLPENNCLVQS